jgi:uncharacterized protein
LITVIGSGDQEQNMPQFVIHCLDKPQALELRLAHRPAHLDYARSYGAQLVLAGPLLDEAGNPKGSLLILEAADASAAQAFADHDPYALAGLFASVAITPFRTVLPEHA